MGAFLEKLWDGCNKSKSIYFGRTRTDFLSLSRSRILAITDARSYLERPVSFSSWSINVVAGRPHTRPPWASALFWIPNKFFKKEVGENDHVLRVFFSQLQGIWANLLTPAIYNRSFKLDGGYELTIRNTSGIRFRFAGIVHLMIMNVIVLTVLFERTLRALHSAILLVVFH